jgi:hypothetical protein
MKNKYQVNVKKISHQNRNRSLSIYSFLIILIIFLLWLVIHYFLLSNTKINHPKAVISKVSSSSLNTASQKYSASDFSFSMPTGWTKVTVSNSPYHLYEWQYGKGSDYRTVEIFEDSSVSNLAVNKVIIVSGNASQISVLGPPSDNCANFTKGAKTSTLTGYPAKWMGVDFNCDLNNPTADTVGISSAQAINSVNLISPTNAHHSFYFLYSDHSLSPNYSDFNELLTSFVLN